MLCNACPFECGVDRTRQLGLCRAPETIRVSQAQLHLWEEPPISGGRGSGTVFFTYCNLRCRFCQNHDISQAALPAGSEVSAERLVEIMLTLAKQGAHNVNLVSPTHYTEQLIPVLRRARPELGVPVVWNSNGYEKAATLARLEGLVDVFLPDFKYWSDDLATRCSRAPEYAKHASGAVLEMFRQTGRPKYNEDGIIQRGVIVRHLVLPGQAEDSTRVLDWIAEVLGNDVLVSLMAQYYPTHRAAELASMNRPLAEDEYRQVLDHFHRLGLDGFTQELSSAIRDYTPHFEGKGL